MTPYSFQSVPVPDRYISRLRHSQSGTRGPGVKDSSLRAIQIRCTLFHPFRCLSLALFSFLTSVSFFLLHIHISSLFLYLSRCLPLSFTPFLPSQFFHNSHFPIFFSLYFPLYPCEIGHFLSWVRSMSITKAEGVLCVCDCMWSSHVCPQAISQSALFKTIFSSRVISSAALWSRGQHWFIPIFSRSSLSHHLFLYAHMHRHFHTYPNACMDTCTPISGPI